MKVVSYDDIKSMRIHEVGDYLKDLGRDLDDNTLGIVFKIATDTTYSLPEWITSEHRDLLIELSCELMKSPEKRTRATNHNYEEYRIKKIRELGHKAYFEANEMGRFPWYYRLDATKILSKYTKRCSKELKQIALTDPDYRIREIAAKCLAKSLAKEEYSKILKELNIVECS